MELGLWIDKRIVHGTKTHTWVLESRKQVSSLRWPGSGLASQLTHTHTLRDQDGDQRVLGPVESWNRSSRVQIIKTASGVCMSMIGKGFIVRELMPMKEALSYLRNGRGRLSRILYMLIRPCFSICALSDAKPPI